MFPLITSLALVWSQQPVSATAALREYLDLQAAKGFHGILYVEQDGRELFWHSVGFAERDRAREFTKNSLFDIGSIVKPMVRVALFRAVARGLLNSNDTLPKFFSNVPLDKRSITVEQLATHTAGFQDTFGPDYTLIGRDDLMRQMLSSKLLFEPGSKSEYSNSGYSMLATILEKTTGKSIEAFVAETNFRALGMTRSGYVLPKWNRADLVVGYRKDGSRFGTPMDQRWYIDGPSWHLRGNGGMLSTAPELAKWSRGLHTGALLSEAEHKIFAPNLHKEDAARRYWGAVGGNGIFNTMALYNPGKRLVIVGASTDARFEIESLGRELIDKVAQLIQ